MTRNRPQDRIFTPNGIPGSLRSILGHQMSLSILLQRVGDHEKVMARVREVLRPYDRLVLRDPKLGGRWIGTVLACDRSQEAWLVTAVRCPPTCWDHHRKR